MENLNPLLIAIDDKMKKAYQHIQSTLVRYQVHQVHPDMLKGLTIDHYGVASPIEHLANISTRDSSTLIVKPWDKQLLAPIEKAIAKYTEINFATQRDEEAVYAVKPQLNEEARQQLVKQVSHKIEESKITIRNIRKSAKTTLKAQIHSEDELKEAENRLQKLTDKWITSLTTLQNSKKKAILQV